MNYQKIICWGDSQTFGARSYGCYPLYLAQILNERTRYVWQSISLATNGHTARDLWLRISSDLLAVDDVYQACILIGANDVGQESPVAVFAEYYRQILNALAVHGFRVAFCGEIPPIWPDGHAFFEKATEDRRTAYNDRIRALVEDSAIARLVPLSDLGPDCYTDPVHLNETGNETVAARFADAIAAF